MGLEPEFLKVWAAALAGLALSVLLARPWTAWGLHLGLWMLAYGGLAAVLVRPWFAMIAVSAVLLTLVLVSNAKFRSLREPFLFQDWDYFTDAIRYPRLYIPFLGWPKFLAAAAGFALAVAVGLWLERPPASPWSPRGHLGGAVGVLAIAIACLAVAASCGRPLHLQPARDLRELGLLASLWRYAMAGRAPLPQASPFALPATAPRSAARVRLPSSRAATLPHLVAVQSESFFDARRLYAGIRPDVLRAFDRLKSEALAHGRLTVPAWGANTVRTEFAFLSGTAPQALGVHRFNPYRAVVARGRQPSLASYLRALGYRTVCVHPYPARFYQRARVYPRLGFDEFIDIRAFTTADWRGPYVGDEAVADRVAAILREARVPVFVMAITMENHGPLHLERVRPEDAGQLYRREPPARCEDLTIYLRHLRNADRMAATLHGALESLDRAASLCWYGDHVPILPQVYRVLGEPDGRVDYLCWTNRGPAVAVPHDTAAHDLSPSWLRGLGLLRALA